MERSKMKTTNTKQKHIWEIDDVIYYLNETDKAGDVPEISKGYVEEIRRDSIRVKEIYSNGDYNLTWIPREAACTDINDLCDYVINNIEEQRRKFLKKA